MISLIRLSGSLICFSISTEAEKNGAHLLMSEDILVFEVVGEALEVKGSESLRSKGKSDLEQQEKRHCQYGYE